VSAPWRTVHAKKSKSRWLCTQPEQKTPMSLYWSAMSQATLIEVAQLFLTSFSRLLGMIDCAPDVQSPPCRSILNQIFQHASGVLKKLAECTLLSSPLPPGVAPHRGQPTEMLLFWLWELCIHMKREFHKVLWLREVGEQYRSS